MITYDPDLKIFFSTMINNANFFSGFGTRELGDARQSENIVNFFQENDIQFNRIVTLEQIHSANIENYENKSTDKLVKIAETDGVITTVEKVALTVITADCVPIIFSGQNGIIGISHQGWRNSIKSIAQKMINNMVEQGAQKENIKIAIGPSINDCCYNINEERYYSFLEEFDGFSEKIFHRRHGKLYLNLPLLNYLLLLEVGIPKKNIDYFPFCTQCDRKRFFSFRRDNKNEFGEMMNFIIRLNNIV